MSIYYYAGMVYDSNYLEHHGVKGQKWGIRRYQNPDGTLTNAGRARYSIGDAEHDLGFGNKKRLNTLEKRFRMNYRFNKIGEDRSYKKAAKAQYKGKDPTKYLNRAKQFMKNAEMQKKMNMNYQKLDERERKRFNASVVAGQYAAQFLGGAIGQSIYQLNLDRKLRDRLG